MGRLGERRAVCVELFAAQGALDRVWEDGFYEEVFNHLRMPHMPVRWEPDRNVATPGSAARHAEIAKEAAVIQLIGIGIALAFPLAGMVIRVSRAGLR